jgi:hypothetical protein
MEQGRREGLGIKGCLKEKEGGETVARHRVFYIID